MGSVTSLTISASSKSPVGAMFAISGGRSSRRTVLLTITFHMLQLKEDMFALLTVSQRHIQNLAE